MLDRNENRIDNNREIDSPIANRNNNNIGLGHHDLTNQDQDNNNVPNHNSEASDADEWASAYVASWHM